MSTDSRDDDVTTARVRERLDRVTDPELDTSIVELDYVDEIRIDGGEVRVAVTLPTAWCSPAFAWMMATDARDAVETLPGVTRAAVELQEHMHETEINRGVNEGLSFAEAFPDADGGVEPVRAELDEKARLARQHDATGALLAAGVSEEQIAELTRSDVELDDGADRAHVWLRDGAFAVGVDADPLARYLEKAAATGLLDDDHAELFRTPDGEPIDPDAFETVHHRTRAAGVNMSGQGSVCDALHESRTAADRPPLSSR
ncbi:iron-sulfur cluster assembly protein [Haloplanus rallus]|jgi:metal-sulfur cluster biosynthetic enzyme|uniref:Iron-sulfur cluster assembly protein n=1 Tax=Haloplanus rallus TaxID=1816183 RepID=A0A6B9FEX1_9EURY|nr:iron-sulfur cluster assembly protein [Haloplanus rallus]QGX95109.1 iron-sulfur cluster assembly protein [Haloplanus rallus]